jgi:hypothetical protein
MTRPDRVDDATWHAHYTGDDADDDCDYGGYDYGDERRGAEGWPTPPHTDPAGVAGEGHDSGGAEDFTEDGIGDDGGSDVGASSPDPAGAGAGAVVGDADDTAGYLDADEPVVDLDAGSGRGAADDRDAAPRRFDGRVAAWFSGAAVLAVLAALIGALLLYGSGDKPGPVTQASLADPAAAAPPAAEPPAPAASVGNDRPLPYSADAAGSCPAGSTSAQTMTGTDPHNAFVCVRNGVDGQVIDIDLSKTYTVTAISLTPGWVGPDASGVSQWPQHRVVTTVQYMFNDTDRILLTQETKNVHGEAVLPVKRVLASKVRMLIRQTSRPPADTPQTSPAPHQGLFPELPVPTSGPTTSADRLFGAPNTDPVDATFAISSLKIIGHEPL